MKFVTIQASQDRMVQSTADWVAQRLQGYDRPVRLRFCDGTTVESENCSNPRVTLLMRTREPLAGLFRPPLECSLGESYIWGDVDVVGNFQDVFPLAEYLLAQKWTLSDRLRFMWHHVISPYSQAKRLSVYRTGARHSPARDFSAVQFHYDLPPEFYRLWLDRRMLYSCAYFTRGDDDLDEAQADKLDYMCRKLRLQPGDRVLDIGCGWGGFALYAAQYYGASVVGITLSLRQAEVARKRIAAAGLTQQCTIGVADYRDLADQEAFDKIVSTEMVKHVGRSQLHRYFHQVHRLLKPGGVFLNHEIASCDGDSRLGPFADRYVFPDAEVVPLHQVVTAAEAQEWEVRDVESLREQYALTLDHWVRRLELEHGRAVDLVGETTYRVWRLYLAASAYWFRKGRLNVYQVLCAKPSDGRSGLPLTREDWYGPLASDKAHEHMSAAAS
ncbi:MAG: cyclopropane-fatty-acyl-phospholipid synthase [Nitrospira sp.]